MLDNLFLYIFKKIKNHPCNKCLIRGICTPEDYYKKPCEYYFDKYHRLRRKFEEIGNGIDLWIIIGLIMLGCLWFAFTLFLGVYHQIIFVKGFFS
jgi:hypothetical protein